MLLYRRGLCCLSLTLWKPVPDPLEAPHGIVQSEVTLDDLFRP